MELEEMKTLWAEMSVEIENQKKLTGSLIMKMTKTDYKNKINKILIPEAISSLVCLAQIVFILLNIQRLDTWYLLVCGITSIITLSLLPILSIKALRNMRSVNISNNTYKQSLLEYSKGKIQFVFVQKLSFYVVGILLVVVLPVMTVLLGGKDPFKGNSLWIWYPVCYLFYYPMAKWVLKKYLKITDGAENILKELDS